VVEEQRLRAEVQHLSVLLKESRGMHAADKSELEATLAAQLEESRCALAAQASGLEDRLSEQMEEARQAHAAETARLKPNFPHGNHIFTGRIEPQPGLQNKKQ
jgi:hypothetical protein